MSVYFCGGSCIEDMTFYIRANRCGSLYDDIFALRGWKKVELGGIEFELASILIEKGKAYRLVIQRQKRIDGELDLWEGDLRMNKKINILGFLMGKFPDEMRE